MRHKSDVEGFHADALSRTSAGRASYEAGMYAGSVPELHWFVRPSEVKHNQEAFARLVIPYTRRLSTALRTGYGLLFIGDNGTGKTMFVSYALGRAVRRGFGVYYTTLAQLDNDIKRGFDDKAYAQRLRELLDADFLAIDELGKEHFRKDSYLNTQLEALLKQRYDDGYPTLLASNLDHGELVKMYGPTIASMLEGRYEVVALEGGDYRGKAKSKLRREMGLP